MNRVRQWALGPAQWWQFWRPQSGPAGGLIGGLVGIVLVNLLMWCFA